MVLAAVTVGRAAAEPAEPNRAVWVYDGGYVQDLGDGVWFEQSQARSYSYTEAARTPEYVELYEPASEMTVRLYADALWWRSTEHPVWHRLCAGEWQDPNLQRP